MEPAFLISSVGDANATDSWTTLKQKSILRVFLYNCYVNPGTTLKVARAYTIFLNELNPTVLLRVRVCDTTTSLLSS